METDTIENTATDASQASTMLINGERVPARSGLTFPSLNPATGELVGHVSAGDAEDVDAVVRATRAAFEDRRWLSMPTTQRAKIMFAIADGIEAAAEEL